MKHINNTGDYKTAYDIANRIKKGEQIECLCTNIKVFRKYLYEVGAKLNINFCTRKIGETGIEITRL